MRHNKKSQFMEHLQNFNSPFAGALNYLDSISSKWKEFRRKNNGADPSIQLELDYDKVVSLVPEYSDLNYSKHRDSFIQSLDNYTNKHRVIYCLSQFKVGAKQELIHALGVIQSLKVQGKSSGQLPCNKLLTIYRSPVYLLVQSFAGWDIEQEQLFSLKSVESEDLRIRNYASLQSSPRQESQPRKKQKSDYKINASPALIKYGQS